MLENFFKKSVFWSSFIDFSLNEQKLFAPLSQSPIILSRTGHFLFQYYFTSFAASFVQSFKYAASLQAFDSSFQQKLAINKYP